MFWNKQDFAREVCRQLVELASIRKRVEGDPELLEKIRSLEASHEGLLRKLAEAEQSPGQDEGADVRGADRIATPEPERPRRKATRKSRSAPSPAAGVARRKTDPGAERRSDPGGMQASVVRSTRRFLLSVCAELRSLQPTEESASGTISEDSLPRLDETCGACGKVLLSSVLGGESVSCRAGRWYHRRCLPGRDGRGRPELRN